ncbi:MAG: Spy/CpxP family protein refolding chaperone [Myxococcaceae bacterium]
MKSRTLGFLGLSALAVVALSAWGPHACGKPDAARKARFVTAMVDDTLDDLDATDEQRAAVHGLKDRLLAEGFALRDDNKAARTQFLTQWQSAQPNTTELHTLVDSRMTAVTAFAHKLADAALELHTILTPAQRAELGERMAKHDRH